MDSHADTVLFLANFRHQELLQEVAQYRQAREAYGAGPTVLAAISTACRQLGATLARARQHLERIRWTPALTRRGALPH